MFIRLLPAALAGLLALGTSAPAQPLRVPVSAASATALDRYVAAPDPAYKWAVIATRSLLPPARNSNEVSLSTVSGLITVR